MEKGPYREVIGLLPAGGQATRIAPLPCSKELYPVGFRPVEEGRSLRPKVVCHYLLEKMQLAGITRVYIVLRQGKWDIPAYLGDGTMLGMHLAYLMMHLPFGAPYTVDQAYPFVQDSLVALGFPDVIFQPDDAFVQLLARQAATNADVVLGLFPADQPQFHRDKRTGYPVKLALTVKECSECEKGESRPMEDRLCPGTTPYSQSIQVRRS